MKNFLLFLLLLILPLMLLCSCRDGQSDLNDDITDTADSSSIITNQETTPETPPETADYVTTSLADLIKDPAEIEFRLTQEAVSSLKATLYPQFNNCSTESVLIPGLNQYMVPQGMDIWEEMNWLIISGYFSSNEFSENSVLVAVDLDTGVFMGEYFMQNADGTVHASHAGGVAVTGKNIFISNGGKLFRIPLTELFLAEQSGIVRIADEIIVPTRASFCNYSHGVLWVGDFQYGSTYPTDEFCYMKNRDGNMYYAWAVGYELSENTENEIKASSILPECAIPDYILSITDRIQGMAVVSDDYIALSQSYGRGNDSTILIYNNPMGSAPHDYFEYKEFSVPVWFLDNHTGVKKLTVPPMSEGIAARGNELYILFESGATTYRTGGGKNPSDRVWVTDILKAVK